jgi:hypothetical protein
LAQANDKWKPITLADGAFDLDELKRDVSMADSKFSARKYKPTALILEYLVSRAAKQGVAAPAFVTNKSPSAKKRRAPEDVLKRGTKRFKAGRSRPTYSMDQDTWDDEGHEDANDAGWEEDEGADDEGSSTWDTLAFQQKATFPHAVLQREEYSAHALDRSVLQDTPTERKRVTCRRASFSSFC